MHFYAVNLNFHCILQVMVLRLVLNLRRGEFMLCETQSSCGDGGVGGMKMLYAMPGKLLYVFGLGYHLFVLCDLNHLEFSVIYLRNH